MDLKKKVNHQRQYCLAKLSRKSSRSGHLLIQPNNPQFKCSVCDKVFLIKSNRDKHLVTHTGEKPFSCVICEKRFRTNGDMKNHCLYVHLKEKPFSCSVCKKCFVTKRQVKIHELIHRDVGNEFECLFCAKKLRNQRGLYLHIPSHLNERSFECRFCQSSFMHPGRLRYHVTNSHNNVIKLRNYFCIMCQKSFPTRSSLSEHIKFHTREKPHSCSKCEVDYHQKRQLQVHIQTVHKKVLPFVCELCGKASSTNGGLQDHIRRHLGEKRFECKICNKRFVSALEVRLHEISHQCPHCPIMCSSAMHLANHIQKYHGGKGLRYDCPCGAKFQNAHLLKTHKDSFHKGERIYKCDICPKTFVQKSTMLKHRVIHLNKRNFKCKVCNKAFMFKDKLDRHLKSHGGKPFGCSVCKMRFCSPSELNQHERIHKVPMDKCVFCGKQFGWHYLLNEHILHHIKEKFWDCRLCDKSFDKIYRLRTHFQKTHNKHRRKCAQTTDMRINTNNDSELH